MAKETAGIGRITLIGVGLIGGSFVLDLKRQGRVRQVVGVDCDAANLARALERRVIDEAYGEICAGAVAGSDMVLIATPVAALPAVCRSLAPLLRPGVPVSDVGSTKQSVLAAFSDGLPQHLPWCVAAHPIAGSDRHGALAAQFGLYQDKKLILCPHETQDAGALATVAGLWRAVGAEVYEMAAAEHDAVFAAVSHLPHVLAFAYVNQIAGHADGARFLDFAASGFRDFTRIASSHPAIWRDICLANRQDVSALLAGHIRELESVRTLLETADSAALYRYFERAKTARDDWLDAQV
ncbi:prephenate dehydrogenase/arogenate dehydrogenase family protein [Neisseria leonii]|uniref:prephenate dehydrogenase n=1 Tax=Neisseria leonii TaxID=2995413 RepID=A0A9X4E4L5_9NEIS|nr:prephenate dehydrogenase/arogenate dehydrogenase family protein [Neisseria sp. 51.81]MDD9327272.1 prephenate dehydrogenase/arogenate dehydrogenase family protein [Neisseria sp. 51.81]